ncbi:MAG: DNA polymerase III subunit delta [Sphingomonadales bacterium]
MKIKPWEVDRFVRRPGADIVAALCFGRDEGLIRERAAALGRLVVEDLTDPFRVAELTVGDITEDGGRLADEAAAISMTGGRRLVRIERASDSVAATAGDYLARPATEAFLVITAGDLSPRSKLRKLFEASANAAALPCYPDQSQSLEALINEVMADHGLGIEPDARNYLRSHLGSDRAVSRRELEKLALYKAGPDPGADSRVTLSDATACVGDSAALSLDEAAEAALAGDLFRLETALARTFHAGQSPIAVLRVMAKKLQRLHLLAGLTERGMAIDTALKKLKPPAFQREAKSLSALARRWPAVKLVRALEIVTEAELGCKTTGAPAETICARAFMTLAVAARR